MGKGKRKLTPAEKAQKKRMRKEYMTIFIKGKQKRVKRPPTIDGMDTDAFIRINADPIWLLQNERYEEFYQWEQEQQQGSAPPEPACGSKKTGRPDDDLPF